MTIATVPTIMENVSSVIKINYANSKDNRLFREIYLYSKTNNEGVTRYSVAAYGRNNSFAVGTFETQPEALAYFNELMKEGK